MHPTVAGCRHLTIVADQIKRHAREGQPHTYTLFLVPRTSTLITRILEEEGVLGDVTISSYNLQLIPIAEDVVSLEHDTAFKEIWVVSPSSSESRLILISMVGWRRDGHIQLHASSHIAPRALWAFPANSSQGRPCFRTSSQMKTDTS